MSSNPSRSEHGPVTSPTLLRRLQAWDDQTAWNCFFTRYSPLFEKWSRARLRNPADIQEVNQRVVWEVAQRLVSFEYHPSRSFRGFLRTLHSSRLLDFLKSEKRRQKRELDVLQVRNASSEILADQPSLDLASSKQFGGRDRDSVEQCRRRLAQQIQSRVQSRVNERTWQVFWEIAVQGNSIAETAQRYSMRYASAFAAYSRVYKMLQQEASTESQT